MPEADFLQAIRYDEGLNKVREVIVGVTLDKWVADTIARNNVAEMVSDFNSGESEEQE